MVPGKGFWRALTGRSCDHSDGASKKGQKVDLVRTLIKVEIRHQIKEFRSAMRLWPKGEEVLSDKVSSPLAPDFMWHLCVRPKNSDWGSAFFLYLTGPAVERQFTSLDVTYSICLKDVDDSKHVVAENSTEKFTSIVNRRGVDKVSRYVLNQAIHPDGSLLVVVDLEFYARLPAIRSSHTAPGSSQTNYKLGVSDSFAQLLKSGVKSDFTIEVGNEKLPAHRCILAARSPYFEALFASDHNCGYSEVKSGVLKVDDFEKQPVEAMLSFIYTGEIDDATVEKWEESLLQLADKYHLDEMKSFMGDKVAASLCVETFVHVALLADSHHCQALKEACVTYLRNNFEQVTSGDMWKELKRGNQASVAAEMLEKVHSGQ